MVAVKFLRTSLLFSEESTIGFQRELKQLRSLRHSNILSFLGAGEWTDRRLFLVTEFCALGSLQSVLASSRAIDWKHAWIIALHVSRVSADLKYIARAIEMSDYVFFSMLSRDTGTGNAIFALQEPHPPRPQVAQRLGCRALGREGG